MKVETEWIEWKNWLNSSVFSRPVEAEVESKCMTGGKVLCQE